MLRFTPSIARWGVLLSAELALAFLAPLFLAPEWGSHPTAAERTALLPSTILALECADQHGSQYRYIHRLVQNFVVRCVIAKPDHGGRGARHEHRRDVVFITQLLDSLRPVFFARKLVIANDEVRLLAKFGKPGQRGVARRSRQHAIAPTAQKSTHSIKNHRVIIDYHD